MSYLSTPLCCSASTVEARLRRITAGTESSCWPLAPCAIRVPAGISHQVLEAVGNVAAKQCQPVDPGHELKVSLEGLVQLGAIQDHPGSSVVPHLLEGEGCAQHVLRELLPAGGICCVNAHAVVSLQAMAG